MSISESDLGGFATTEQDAMDEIGSYFSYDNYGDSQPVNQNYQQRNLSPQHLQNYVPFNYWGGGYPSAAPSVWNHATEQDMIDSAIFMQDGMGLLQKLSGGSIREVPGGGPIGWEHPNPGSIATVNGKDVTQDMTKVGGGNSFVPQSGWDINAASPANPTNNPFDLNLQFNQDPAAKAFRDNISGILNPTGEQIASIQDKASQGEQTADARSWVFDKLDVTDPKIALDEWRKQFKNDVGDAVKTGLDAVGDAVGEGWDWMTEDQVNKTDPVENFETLSMPTQPTDNDLFQHNLARYKSLGPKSGNTGPIGPDGTNFSPGRWKDYENYKPPTAATSGADNIARILNTNIQLDPRDMYANINQRTDALTYEDRQAMSKKQIVELINNRGTTSTINAVGYEPYGKPGVVTMFGVPMGEAQDSYKPIYSPEDENLINLFKMKGFDAEEFKNIKGGGQTSIGLPSSFKDEPLLSVTPGIDLMGLGVVGLGAFLSKNGFKDGFDFIAKHGLENWNTLKKAVSEAYKGTKPQTSLAKHDVKTIEELGMMKPKSNSTHLGGPGKTLTGEGKITRGIDKPMFGFEKKYADDILKFKGTNKQRLIQRNKDLKTINLKESKDVGAKQSMDKGYVNSRVKGKGQLKQPDTPQARIAQSNKAQSDARAAQKVAMDKKRADVGRKSAEEIAKIEKAVEARMVKESKNIQRGRAKDYGLRETKSLVKDSIGRFYKIEKGPNKGKWMDKFTGKPHNPNY